ncbi:MAG: hypothetical protein R6W92_12440 [Desulfocurvibacter africanus]
MKDLAHKVDRAINKRIAALMPTQYVIHPALKSLIDLGISTVLISEWLEVTQGTISNYANGVRNVPKKHESKLYSMLETALKRADRHIEAFHDNEKSCHDIGPVADRFRKEFLDRPRALLKSWEEHQRAISNIK